MRSVVPEIILKCDCGCSMLRVQKWLDHSDLFSFRLYLNGRACGLWDRIKTAYYFIKYGESPFNDMIITTDDVEQLRTFLSDIDQLLDKTPTA